MLLVDEAYVDFVDPALRHDMINMVRAFDNVLLLRTLSKGYSLAGLRFGYGIGAPNLIEPMLTKTRDSYNVDAIAQAVACAGFRRSRLCGEHLGARSRRTRADCAMRFGRAASTCRRRNRISCSPRRRSKAGSARRALYAALKERGILVRYFDAPRLDDKMRITVGDPITERSTARSARRDLMA